MSTLISGPRLQSKIPSDLLAAADPQLAAEPQREQEAPAGSFRLIHYLGLVSIVFVLALIIQKHFVQGMTMGAVR